MNIMRMKFKITHLKAKSISKIEQIKSMKLIMAMVMKKEANHPTQVLI